MFGVTVEVYFTCTLQVKYIPASTGEADWYSCTVSSAVTPGSYHQIKFYLCLVKNLPSGSYSVSHLAWHCFRCAMDSYCSLFNYSLRIIIIALFRHDVFLSSYMIETVFFSWLLIMEKIFERAVMWRQLVSFKEFIRPRMKVTSSWGINFLDYLSFYSYRVWCWTYYLLFNTISITLVVGRTYEFIHEVTIPHLTYWTYAQMDVAFVNPM